MRELNLIARFPLGVYIGHSGKGAADRFPSPLRLHSALLNSAGQGTAAVEESRGLGPSEKSLAALSWLEENPPSAIEEPAGQWVDPSTRRFIYREVSSVNEKRRTEERRLSDGRAVKGHVGYRWVSVPDDIAETIVELCRDVSCLGETESVVVLEPGDVRPTIELDTEGSVFDARGIAVEIPASGRTAELRAAHARRFGKRIPTVSSDKVSRSEEPLTDIPPLKATSTVMYRSVSDDVIESNAPWNRVLLLELGGPEIPDELRTEVCLAMHRALVSSIGAGASSMVTGKYEAEVRERPPNRLAIQYLEAEHIAQHGVDRHAIALMLPSDATDQELEQLGRGLGKLKKLWSKNIGRRRLSFNGIAVNAEEFWAPPKKGTVRMWRPDPVAVSEIRPPRRRESTRRWTLADAGLLSLGFVWRNEIPASGRGMSLYRQLRDGVAAKGAFVSGAATVGAHTRRFVHRTQRDISAQTWTGRFHLGDLSGPRTLIAVGQSRHLGGGLLVPDDVPESLFLSMVSEERTAP